MEGLRGASGASPCCACGGLDGGPPVGQPRQLSPHLPRLLQGRRALLLLAAAAAACSLAAADPSAVLSRPSPRVPEAPLGFLPGHLRHPQKEETAQKGDTAATESAQKGDTAATETAQEGDTAATKAGEPVMRVSKPHVMMDCSEGDLEDIRQLLLAIPEYPVKYGPATMRSFSRFPHFFEMCVTAREVLKETAAEEDTETAAETDAETDEETAKGVVLGKNVGVVAAAEMGRGSANILMVAVAKEFRRMGLAKRMMKAVLAKAGRLRQEGRGSFIINEALLHVWISQVAPLTLYLSFGFRPSKYLPFYYREQLVSAGYEMHLPIPYEPVEAAYQQQIKTKEKKLTELEQALLETGATLRFRGSSEAIQFRPTAFVNAVTSEAQISDPLLAFLKKEVPTRGLDPSAALKQILGSPLPQLSIVAVEPEGDVSGVIWVRSPPENGLIDSVTLFVNEDAGGFKYLSLFGILLAAASAFPDVRGVQHKMVCEDFQSLVLLWKLGLKPVRFMVSAGHNIQRGLPAYEYSMETTLPWSPREELTLTLKNLLLDKAIAYAEERLHVVLQLLPKPAAAGAAAPRETAHKEPGSQETAAGPQETAGGLASPDSHAAKEKAAGPPPPGGPSAGGRAPEKPVAWYQTLAGVAGIIAGCSFLMFFCFRLCARRGQAAAAAAGSSQSGEVKGGCMQQQRGQNTSPQRPKGRKEGYSQVTEETAESHAADAAEPWWDQEDVHAFSAN